MSSTLAKYATLVIALWLPAVRSSGLNPGTDLPAGFVSISGGVFRMGDTIGDLEPNSLPVHEVRLGDYALAAHLVTAAEAAVVFDWALAQKLVTVSEASINLPDGGREQLFNLAGMRGFPADLVLEAGRLRVRPGREKYPCVFITWYGAAAFCNFRSMMDGRQPCFSFSDWGCRFDRNGYRLPTEAEYEYAARDRGREIKFPWGDGAPRLDGKPAANVADETGEEHFARLKIAWRNPLPLPWPGYADGHATLSPVDAYPPSPLGLYDIAGNAWEFCYDWFGPYSAEPQDNPRGPAQGSRKCMRGGAWMNPDPHVFRCSFRDEDQPTFQYYHAGFRLALGR